MATRSLATSCKPCLGYSSKSAAIIALKKEGKTYVQIGKLLDMCPKACSSLMSKTLKRAHYTQRTIALENNLFLDLERYAHKKGFKANEMAAKILKAVVADNLFEAVLDGD